MDKPMEPTARAGSRKWIILSIWLAVLVIVGSGIVWQLYRILPGWIEDTAGEVLLENGVVLTELPVESIGFSQSQIGRGGLVFESHSLTWEGIWIDYHFSDLLDGHLGSVLLEAPVVSIQLPDMQGGEEAVQSTTDTLDPIIVEVDPDQEIEVVEDAFGDTRGSIAQPPEQAAMEEDADEAEVPVAANLWESLQGLKFGAFRIRDGVVDISLLDQQLASLSLDSEIVKQPFGVSGECSLVGENLSSNLSLRAPAAMKTVTVQGNLVMPDGAFKKTFDLVQPLVPALYSAPALVSSGNLVMDLLVELDEESALQASAEIELEELVMLESGSGLEFSINNLLSVGYFKDGVLSLESGAELLLSPTEDYRLDSFGLRFSLDSINGIRFESESFGWNYSSFEGIAAIRGSGSMPMDEGRMEIALSEVIGDWVVLEPFSVLVEAKADSLLAKASEIGARKMDTIWIESLAIESNRDLESGNMGFTWYDAIGLHMGDVKADFTSTGDDYSIAYSMNQPGKPTFMTGEFERKGTTTSLNAEGKLLSSWINSLASWWGGVPAKFGGSDPDVQIELSGMFPFYSGKGKVELSDFQIELDGDTRLEGINGSTAFSIVGVPTIPELQKLTIKTIASGQFELQDVELDWTLPTFRHFEVKRFEAKIGGGTMSLDPFKFDPFKPVLQTQIHIDHLEGNQLLEWLGETRFSVEGSVSGRLAIGWRNGDIILGDGILELDSTEHDGRFVFEDPSFLKEQFDSFGGIQEDLKNRFLSALLEEGIEIHSLEISLGAAPEAGKILLRMAVSGETKNELLEVPIEGFIINNVISGEDLGRLMGLIGPVRIRTDASGRN
ncbi:MAG: YdbH domain-containing protein [Puniceicoccaceae bacterium]